MSYNIVLNPFRGQEFPKKPYALVTGSSGHIGKATILNLVKEGYHVVAAARNITQTNTDRLSWIKVNSSQITQQNFWESVLKEYPQISAVVNCIGAPVAPKGMALEDINVKPLVAIGKAIKTTNRNVKLVHTSSMASTMLKDPYGTTKKQAEEELLDLNLDHSGILRIGYVFERFHEGDQLARSNTHAYGPEQNATLPCQPIIGSGKQPIQPVFIDDIVTAIHNYVEKGKGVEVVNAVGREVLTQEEFFKFYTDLIGKPFNPLYIPYDVAELLAKYFPKGHLAPYAIEGCRLLDENPVIHSADKFEALLGREAKSLKEVLFNGDGKQVVYARPPVLEHMREGLAVSYKDPSIILKTLKAFYRVALHNSTLEIRALERV